MSEELDYTKITSHDLIQKRLIDFAFMTCTRATGKEEPIADFTHKTGFIRSVKLLKSMLWKYTPSEIKEDIKTMYDVLDKSLCEVEGSSNLSEPNKRTTKQRLEDETAMDVLELLIVVLQYSPSNVEMREMEVFTKDMDNIISKIRTTDKVSLFNNKDIELKASEE